MRKFHRCVLQVLEIRHYDAFSGSQRGLAKAERYVYLSDILLGGIRQDDLKIIANEIQPLRRDREEGSDSEV